MSTAVLGIVEGPRLAHAVPHETIPQFVRSRIRQWPDDVALIDASGGARYTFGDVDRLVGRFAAGLVERGLQPGDTLLMFAPNSPEWAIAALGAMAAGGVVSGANPASSAADLARQMRETRARYAFTDAASLATVRAAAAQASCETIVVLGGDEREVSFASVIACTEPEPPAPADLDALASLPYSSGTSGVTKGVILTHRTMVSCIWQVTEMANIDRSDVGLGVLPMYHIYGYVTTLYNLSIGVLNVTLPRFEPQSYLRTIEHYRISHITVVPPLMQFLATHPLIDEYDLSSIKWISCGAAPLSAALQQRVEERLSCQVGQGYGMTESSCVIATPVRDRVRSGSSGLLLPGTQARVIDPETLTDVPRGTPGEIWFRGPQAFKGYLNAPAATAETITSDGWVRTGDIGYFDADGYLYLTDRLKELIKVKAYQVPPAELEGLLLTHPAIADVAVIGRPDERSGEIPVAYVAVREPIDAAAIMAWVAERVVDFKQLGAVVFCESIPKSPSGKILRRLLRERDAQRSTA